MAKAETQSAILEISLEELGNRAALKNACNLFVDEKFSPDYSRIIKG
jgi:hypothetical protein